jgi:hypothetical protein
MKKRIIKQSDALPRKGSRHGWGRAGGGAALIILFLAFAGCKKSAPGDGPPTPTDYRGAELKQLTWADPTVAVAPDGSVTFDYTAEAVFTLRFTQGGKDSARDTTVSGIRASAFAKAGTVVDRVILDRGETLGNPVYTVTGKDKTATSCTETAEFSFNGGKPAIPYTIVSDSAHATVCGTKFPLAFGHGKVVFAGAELSEAVPYEEDGQPYCRQTLTVKAAFAHPQKSASREMPATVVELLTKEPPKVTFVGAEVKSVDWGTPETISFVPTGSLTPWPVGIFIQASYTGTAVLTLTFSDETTKDSTVNIQASTTAKVEKYFVNIINNRLFVEEIIEPSPVVGVVTAQPEVNSVATDIVRFTFVEGEFFLEYSITNSLVSAKVRGKDISVPFGNGALDMRKLDKVYVAAVSKDSKVYRIYNIGIVNLI